MFLPSLEGEHFLLPPSPLHQPTALINATHVKSRSVLRCLQLVVPLQKNNSIYWFYYEDHINIVMEYPAPCKDLWELIDRFKLNEERVIVLIRQAVHAVNHCLDHGVFHNDIHQGNILVNTKTYDLKLIDFDLALENTGDPYPKYR